MPFAIMREVAEEIRKLAEQDESKGDPGDNGAPPALVNHQRGQPSAQTIGPGGDHEDQAEYQRKHQDHRPAPTEDQPQAQAEHRREEQNDAQGQM